MTTPLRVVNDCLAIMGEAPLNAIAEDHAFKAAALATLDRVDESVQAEGWWFNIENLTLLVNPQDTRVYFPTDMGSMLPIPHKHNFTQRGRVLYDLERGSDRFDPGFSLKVQLLRRIPIIDCPVSVSAYIARRTVLEFQALYDGDQTKTRNLTQEVYGIPGVRLGLEGIAKAEHIRNRKVNMVTESVRMSRIRRNTGTTLYT